MGCSPSLRPLTPAQRQARQRQRRTEAERVKTQALERVLEAETLEEARGIAAEALAPLRKG